MDLKNVNSGSQGMAFPYRTESWRLRYQPAASPLAQGSDRALAATANTFARESALDELAHAAGYHPLRFRLDRLADERLAAVLRAAAERFGWDPGPHGTRGHGVAVGLEKNGRVATCAEVTAEADDRIKVTRIVTAYECGAIVSPATVISQIEGGTVMALGGALFEQVTLANGHQETRSLAGYRVPRFSDIPEIDVVLVDRPDIPSACAGETPLIAVAPDRERHLRRHRPAPARRPPCSKAPAAGEQPPELAVGGASGGAGRWWLHRHRDVSGGWLRPTVFGAVDGLVTNASLIAGLGGARVSAHNVILTGVAALVAGVFSMGTGQYVSVTNQNELVHAEVATERRMLARFPAAEEAELAHTFRGYGADPDTAARMAAAVSRYPIPRCGCTPGRSLVSTRSSCPPPWRPAFSVADRVLRRGAHPAAPVPGRAQFPGRGPRRHRGGAAGGRHGRGAAHRPAASRSGLRQLVLGALAVAVTYTVGSLIVGHAG